MSTATTQPPSEVDEASTQHQKSLEEVWFLKEIVFRNSTSSPDESPKRVKIITQNFNGPCSFIAICNILILRGDIEILPYGRSSVSYEFLSQLVGEYLLLTRPDVDISAALSIMPYTRRGMDLNPLFTGPTLFRPAGATNGELQLFEQAKIQLVHGWLVDPHSPEYELILRTEDYDNSVNLIAEADHVAKGRLVVAEHEASELPQAGSSSDTRADPIPSGSASASGYSSPTLSHKDRKLVEDAIAIRSFIDHTQSQLTYHGLFTLSSTLAAGALVALFRNSHLSVLYKSSDPEDSALYTLVTDHVFLHEPSVVWERIEDVEGGAATFVDSDFLRSSPVGGDYAGHTGEGVLNGQMGALTLEEQADEALARQLQQMEEERALLAHTQRELARIKQREQERIQQEEKKVKRSKSKKDCVVM